MRRRFFIDQFEGNSAVLRGESAAHLGRVLRAEPGQLYELSDGRQVWLARVERVALAKRGDNRVDFALVEPIAAHASEPSTSLLLSLIKFDRFEWCLEKATELGVTEIVPLAAERTDKPLIAAAAKRASRWEKILLESAQQSRRTRLPILRGVVRPSDAFASTKARLRIILSERTEAPLIHHALKGVKGTFAALAVGPEGGWTEKEIAAASADGFREASLGDTILRTETAVVAAASILRFALDLGPRDGFATSGSAWYKRPQRACWTFPILVLPTHRKILLCPNFAESCAAGPAIWRWRSAWHW
jgi:16S rRNA (uracil1498-N3)-methyltransferase